MGMTQVTLISLYGEKRNDFTATITACQQFVKDALGSGFVPYESRQIHATIIGLERQPGSPALNANFARHRSREMVMDFDGFLTFLRSSGFVPFEVQIGGFGNRNYPFTSRGKSPYERSFSIQGDKVVVMGWPVRGKPLTDQPGTPAEYVNEARLYPVTLDAVRHAAQRFGILHSYHRAPTDVDNDLFFRLGLVDAKTSAASSAVEERVREHLSKQEPLIVEIGLQDMWLAAYEDEYFLNKFGCARQN
jgi:hypothetical protein